MSDSIESFVARLHQDGVEEGRREGEAELSRARRDAEKIVAEAKKEGERLRAAARKDAEEIISRAGTDLELAIRDALGRLRSSVTEVLSGLVSGAVNERLADGDFLKALIHEVVLKYAQRDAEGESTMDIRLTDEMMHQLSVWAIGEVENAAAQGVVLAFYGGFARSGFEYKVSGATVEVSEESVGAVLGDLVGPELRLKLQAFGGAAEG